MADTVKDPVCGMEFEAREAEAREEHGGRTFYFCSDACRDAFVANPDRWGQPGGGFEHDHR